VLRPPTRMPAKKHRASHPAGRRASGQPWIDVTQSRLKNAVAFHIAIIVLVPFVLYAPSFNNGYIWDDADYVTANRLIQGNSTIFDIWFTHQTPQYYPITFSTFWLEHKIWGLDPRGYHAVNCVLHIANAVLLYFLMQRLVNWLAFPVALIFAVHPIQVETVAWITERKNVLAVLFFLLAVHFSLKHHTEGRFKDYLCSFVTFGLSLLSKSVTVSFVFVPFLLKWWKKQPIDRWDFFRIIPFCAVGLIAGLHTAWLEIHHVGATGMEWELSVLEKAILPAMIVLFYIYKIFVPFNFVFSYPRWELDPASWVQWIPTVILVVMLAVLVKYREQLGRGAVATFLYFIISLFPALGIFSVYPMRYSFVADHFAYLSTIPMIMFMVGAYHFVLRRVLEPRLPLSDAVKAKIAPLTLTVGALIMGMVVIRHARDFKDATTLWLHVLDGNPRSLLAYNSLGLIDKDRGDIDRAVMWFNKGLEVDPRDVEILNNLGIIMAERNQMDAAFEYFNAARKAKPNYPETYNNIATVYAMQGQEDKALQYYERTLTFSPRFAPALYNLGHIYRNRKQTSEAIRYLERAIDSNPSFLDAHLELGAAYTDLQMYERAIQEFSLARSLNPSDPRPHDYLRQIYRQRNQP
jgi:Tfp pilus assembly protein PilF